ncbi:MAG: YHS domain-containing (seleno)protein [Cyclobacteriaceae bacterium]
MKLLSAIFIGFIFLASSEAFGQYATHGESIAFDGYDLTSYFDGEPVKGKETYSFQYKGLNLKFVSAASKQKFIKNPEKYLPAYGGWCATAVVNGSLVRPSYSLFKIQEEKLLFFEVKAFFNGQTQWEKDPEYNKVVADAQFNRLND